eukprot:snap_masked-scaffold_2-processed-gene-8.29-mRNA-1 protein AED:1.00 eAED:1.00 QI:0/0/0/0/1/1/3/0/89
MLYCYEGYEKKDLKVLSQLYSTQSVQLYQEEHSRTEEIKNFYLVFSGQIFPPSEVTMQYFSPIVSGFLVPFMPLILQITFSHYKILNGF